MNLGVLWQDVCEMSRNVKLRLATFSDGLAIATMSRDLIETGLGWSWTASRVKRSIACSDTVVLVAHLRRRVVGFAIMSFGEEVAHLSLLAVALDYRRARIGRRLVQWLEESALVAGIRLVRLEARANNCDAQAFYERLGFRKIGYVPGYYSGRESAVRMAHELGRRALEVPHDVES